MPSADGHPALHPRHDRPRPDVPQRLPRVLGSPPLPCPPGVPGTVCPPCGAELHPVAPLRPEHLAVRRHRLLRGALPQGEDARLWYTTSCWVIQWCVATSCFSTCKLSNLLLRIGLLVIVSKNKDGSANVWRLLHRLVGGERVTPFSASRWWCHWRSTASSWSTASLTSSGRSWTTTCTTCAPRATSSSSCSASSCSGTGRTPWCSSRAARSAPAWCACTPTSTSTCRPRTAGRRSSTAARPSRRSTPCRRSAGTSWGTSMTCAPSVTRSSPPRPASRPATTTSTRCAWGSGSTSRTRVPCATREFTSRTRAGTEPPSPTTTGTTRRRRTPPTPPPRRRGTTSTDSPPRSRRPRGRRPARRPRGGGELNNELLEDNDSIEYDEDEWGTQNGSMPIEEDYINDDTDSTEDWKHLEKTNVFIIFKLKIIIKHLQHLNFFWKMSGKSRLFFLVSFFSFDFGFNSIRARGKSNCCWCVCMCVCVSARVSVSGLHELIVLFIFLTLSRSVGDPDKNRLFTFYLLMPQTWSSANQSQISAPLRTCTQTHTHQWHHHFVYTCSPDVYLCAIGGICVITRVRLPTYNVLRRCLTDAVCVSLLCVTGETLQCFCSLTTNLWSDLTNSSCWMWERRKRWFFLFSLDFQPAVNTF